MTQLQNEIVLIRGSNSNGEKTNEVWKGIIQGNEIKFEQLQSMKSKRSNHFAFEIQGKIVVFGGEENYKENTKIEIYDPTTKKWTDGPLLPCYLNKVTGNAVMNRQGKIILMTKEKGIGIFDPENNSIDFFEGQFQMRENDRKFYAALLI